MQTAKDKVKTAVTEYKRLFPDEYQQFLKSNQITIGNQKDKWASTGGDNALERHLYDVPEKLHNAIKRLLSGDELEWFNGRGRHQPFEAAKWFMDTFPEFKVSKDF